MKKIFFIFIFIFLGCSKENFNKVENLENFRILAIISSAPEVAALGNSTLSLLISDRRGGGRVISGTVKLCFDPGISLGAEVSCDHDPQTITSSYSIDTINDVDLGAANLYTGLAANTVSVTVPSAVFLGRNEREQFNGVSYIALFLFQVDGHTIKSFKRITATNRGDFNTNPTIGSMKLNGAAISIRPVKGDKLSISASLPQSFSYQTIDGVKEIRTEKSEVAWYVSEGGLSKAKATTSEAVEYKTNPPSGTEVIVAVLRDDRGGVSYFREVLP